MNFINNRSCVRAKELWHYFSTYEKIWFFSIVILATAFCIIFPETDDPTFTFTFDMSEAETGISYDTLDFSGISEDVVLLSVTVNGEIYAVFDFLDVEEYTVTARDTDTQNVKLPRAVTANDTVALDFYPDGEEEDIAFFLVGNGHRIDFSLSDSEECENGVVTENPAKYLVPVWILMLLYLADTVTNITCELLISKQSKWNFAVSLLVEVIEILICIVCMYRFATLAVTLFFWIPCDIISFINWHKHPDREDNTVTEVRKLSGLGEVLILLGIVVFTAGIGYLLTFVEVEGGIFANNVVLKNVVCYLDACTSAVGICNGMFILFRYREQWIAWYVSAILETVINILSGQYVLLVLKAGYLTNTTYGFIKWTKYIKSHKTEIVTENA